MPDFSTNLFRLFRLLLTNLSEIQTILMRLSDNLIRADIAKLLYFFSKMHKYVEGYLSRLKVITCFIHGRTLICIYCNQFVDFLSFYIPIFSNITNIFFSIFLQYICYPWKNDTMIDAKNRRKTCRKDGECDAGQECFRHHDKRMVNRGLCFDEV